MTSTRVRDAVAVVTGGARRLGEAMARALAAEGIAVVLAPSDVDGVTARTHPFKNSDQRVADATL